jgi:hypothetical protein
MVQWITETRCPLLTKPSKPARHGYEYKRNGTANIFVFFMPGVGWRQGFFKQGETHVFSHSLQALLGHSHVETIGCYLHPSAERMQEAVEGV